MRSMILGFVGVNSWDGLWNWKKGGNDNNIIIQKVTGLNCHQVNAQNIYTHSFYPPSTQIKDTSHLDTTDTAAINK